MTRTLADMTPAERDDYVGMWCEDPDGDLVILDRVYELRVDGQVAVSVFHPPSGDRLRYLAPELTPRLDLRRAWPPDGRPVPLPEPEMDMADSLLVDRYARTVIEQDETIQTLSRLLAEAEEAAIERAEQIERVRDTYGHAHTLITEALEGETE